MTQGLSTRWLPRVPLQCKLLEVVSDLPSWKPPRRGCFSLSDSSCRKKSILIQIYIILPKHIPAQPDDEPVEDLKEGDEAESKAKAKEAAHA